MPTLSPEEWQVLSPYLDQALAISEDERAAWLSSLDEQNPALVAQLRALLDEHRVLEQEGFLEKGSFGLPLRDSRARPLARTSCSRRSARVVWGACGWRNAAMGASSGKWR
jgi:hypothetical protein